MSPDDLAELQRLRMLISSAAEGLDRLASRVSQPLALSPAPPALAPSAPASFVMTGDQEKAWAKIQKWLKTSKPFFVLKGVAGSGKSFLMQKVHQENVDHSIYFTAPTNKATGVLSAFLQAPCKTIYSLLGYRMVTNEDQLELTASDLDNLPRLPRGSIIVIDEAGMLPKFVVTLLKELAADRGWRFIFVGDPYQLNPINERTSAVWTVTADTDCRAMMTEVRRFDNELLALSIRIRKAIKARDFKESPIVSNNSNGEGVFTWSNSKTLRELESRDLGFWRTSKVACWRNKTVNNYNDRIREALGFKAKFEPGEAILLGSPVLEDQRIVAHTDEELEVVEVLPTKVRFGEHLVLADELIIKDRHFRLTIPKDGAAYQSLLATLATDARTSTNKNKKAAWAPYWEAKSKFHDARYGYAMTAHRLQGSTVKGMYADQADILANPDSLEAFRMLYVIATRPTSKLVAF